VENVVCSESQRINGCVHDDWCCVCACVCVCVCVCLKERARDRDRHRGGDAFAAGWLVVSKRAKRERKRDATGNPKPPGSANTGAFEEESESSKVPTRIQNVGRGGGETTTKRKEKNRTRRRAKEAKAHHISLVFCVCRLCPCRSLLLFVVPDFPGAEEEEEAKGHKNRPTPAAPFRPPLSSPPPFPFVPCIHACLNSQYNTTQNTHKTAASEAPGVRTTDVWAAGWSVSLDSLSCTLLLVDLVYPTLPLMPYCHAKSFHPLPLSFTSGPPPPCRTKISLPPPPPPPLLSYIQKALPPPVVPVRLSKTKQRRNGTSFFPPNQPTPQQPPPPTQ
jgi:hypothetical protein